MDTKLIGKTDTSNTIARKILLGTILDLIQAVKAEMNQPPVELGDFDTGVLEAIVRYYIGRSPLPVPSYIIREGL